MIVRIYDYSDSKIPLMLYITEKILDSMNLNYYIDTDWLGGPCILIKIESGKNLKILSEIDKHVKEYKKANIVDENQLIRKKKMYSDNQDRLILLELRNNGSKMKEDGYVELSEQKSGIYNSKFHKLIFEKCKYKLQKINNKILRFLLNANEKERITLFVEQFKYIATLYNGNYEDGYISYLSHLTGFFARLNDEETRGLYKDKFEKIYNEYYVKNNIDIEVMNEMKILLDEWKIEWLSVANLLKKNIKKIIEYQDGYLDLDRQYYEFVKNTSQINSFFHNKLLKRPDIKEFINSERMINYRNIINLFYSTLPLFEQSMLKKHFYCYCVIKDVQEKYNNLIMEI